MQNTSLQKGQHKSLSDIVSNISPEKTPFMTLIGKGTIDNVLFHWAEEDLAIAAQNAQVEGADAPAAADNYLVERDNYTQIFAKTVRVSGTSVVNRLAGDTQRLAHQIELRAKELKRDMEFAFVGTTQAKAITSGARMTASFQAQVHTDNIIDKSSSAVTAADLDEVLTRIFEAGGTPEYVMCHPRVRNALVKVLSEKGFVQRDISDKKTLVNDIQVYVSPVGEVRLVNNDLVKFDKASRVGDIIIFDSSMWSVETLRPYRLEDLAKTGDAEARLLVVECGLKNKNQKSAGIIRNVLVG